MSGIAAAAAASAPSVAPPPLMAVVGWGGTDNFAVAGPSGSSQDMGVYSAPLGGYTYSYYFSFGSTGGVDPVSGDGLNIIFNPSGKLGIAIDGFGHRWLSWNGLSLNETEVITVQHNATDGAGNTSSAEHAVTVTRTS